MNPFSASRRFTPRFRGVSFVLLLLATLVCAGATETPSASGPNLTAGLTLERELKGGETHVYPVDLQAEQFLRVQVQEEGIDVEVRLLDPQGAVATGADSLSIGPPRSLEDLAVLTDTPGQYRLEVSSTDKSVQPGRYRLKVVSLRPGQGSEDTLRSEAVRESWAAFHQKGGIQALEHALGLWERLGERRQMAASLLGLGFLHSSAKEESATLDAYLRSAALWGEQTDSAAKSYQSWVLNQAGSLLDKLGRPDEARKRHEEALAIANDVADTRNQATSLNGIGLIDVDQGEIQSGITSLLQALQKAREARAVDIQTKALNNLAYAYDQLAERQEALGYYKQFLELARSSSKRGDEALALNNLGFLYSSLGDWDNAVQYFTQALAIHRQLGDRPGEALTLINIGDALRGLQRFQEARDSFDQALTLGRAIKDLEAQTFALTNEAFLAVKLGRPADAVGPAQEAVRLAQGFPHREANAWFALGTAHRELGEPAAAREELGKALSLTQQRGDRSMEAMVSLALARTEKDAGDLTAALDRVRSTVKTIESIRTRVSDPRLRTSFLAAKQDAYEVYIDILMASRDPEKIAEALQVSEQARARSLLDILNESGTDVRAGVSPALAEQERRLRDELNARDSYRLRLLGNEKPDPKKLAKADQNLEEALHQYRELQAEIRTNNPGYAALTQPQPLSVAEIRRQILDGRALLLEYSLGEKRSFLWAVGPDALHSFELPGRAAIEKAARHYYELVTARNESKPEESLQARKRRIDRADAAAGGVGRELSRLLLAPAERLLGNRPLLIVADGALQYIPFAALPTPSSGAPLTTRHEVVILPSGSALAVLRREVNGRPRAPKTLAIFADAVFQATDERLTRQPGGKTERMKLAAASTRGGGGPSGDRQGGEERPTFRRLPSSLKEARTISSLVPPNQLFLALGFDASRAQATSPGLSQYRNVHFATHGVLDSRRPELSKLVLTLYDEKGKPQDGFLRLNDIYSLHLNADLVVLSACRTALGKEIRGEGLVGLTRGFMYAGAARVVASLWSVEDRATAELMGSFYRAMLRRKLSPAAALRQAQIEMAAQPGRKSPYYWAGFSIQGEWR
jgi:CHAT domain-containing protein/Tfp pilus assembly protein PilF